jgi:hypothetical protein
VTKSFQKIFAKKKKLQKLSQGEEKKKKTFRSKLFLKAQIFYFRFCPHI